MVFRFDKLSLKLGQGKATVALGLSLGPMYKMQNVHAPLRGGCED